MMGTEVMGPFSSIGYISIGSVWTILIKFDKFGQVWLGFGFGLDWIYGPKENPTIN